MLLWNEHVSKLNWLYCAVRSEIFKKYHCGFSRSKIAEFSISLKQLINVMNQNIWYFHFIFEPSKISYLFFKKNLSRALSAQWCGPGEWFRKVYHIFFINYYLYPLPVYMSSCDKKLRPVSCMEWTLALARTRSLKF